MFRSSSLPVNFVILSDIYEKTRKTHARTQIVQDVPPQKSELKEVLKYGVECTELTNQRRQLESPTTLNQTAEDVKA